MHGDLRLPGAAALNVCQLIDRTPERYYLSAGQNGHLATFRTVEGQPNQRDRFSRGVHMVDFSHSRPLADYRVGEA